MIVTKELNGAWVVTDIINGYRIKRMYFDYSKKEAIANFKSEMQHNKQG